MDGTTDIDFEMRESIRLGFFHEHRPQPSLSSVAVRRDRDLGVWFLDVGATGPVDLPASYHGLSVRVMQVPGTINAVAHANQVS
ncbi:MAG TPA: hypothetical protein VMD79_15840 [Solirubrobacteraceae bacterium]|nr:hypothetical protein [Solirubrobacteraceae bacterium]